MRKKIGSILLVVCMLVMLAVPQKAAAATTTKEMDYGKTYQVDLDGDGKKEALKFVTKTSGDRDTFKIYINGKKMYTYSYENMYCAASQIGYTDFNKKDKKKDLFVTFTTDNGFVYKLKIFQYKDGILKTTCSTSPEKENLPFGLGDIRIAPTQKGDGTVTLEVDTPYDKGSLGYYYVEMVFNIKNERLIKAKQSTYKATQYWKKQKYTLTKNITFTTTPGAKKKAFTVKKGTSVYFNRLYCKSEKSTAYVEMRTKQGKTGWMKVTNAKFYKQQYGWC